MASSAVLQASAALKARVRRPSMLKKLAHPEDLIPLFPNGAYVGVSNFGSLFTRSLIPIGFISLLRFTPYAPKDKIILPKLSGLG